MSKRVFTGLRDAKGRKLYESDYISFKYKDKIAPGGFDFITGQIVFENGAFVVKEINFDGYDWNTEANRPMLLWEWLRNDVCTKTRNPELVTSNN